MPTTSTTPDQELHPNIVIAIEEAREVMAAKPLPTAWDAAQPFIDAIIALEDQFADWTDCLCFPVSDGQLLDEAHAVLDLIREIGEHVGSALAGWVTPLHGGAAFDVGRSVVEMVTGVDHLRSEVAGRERNY